MAGKGTRAGAKAGCPYCGAAVKPENLARHLRTVHPARQEAGALAKELEAEARRRPRPRGAPYGGGLLRSKAFLALVLGVVVVAAGAAAYVYLGPPGSGQDPEYTQDITQICYGVEQLAYHRHTLVHITINGQAIVIPPGVGISRTIQVTSTGFGLDATCSGYRPVHTHDGTGQIHIESRIPRIYTLGDFFKLWQANQPDRGVRFDATHLFDKDTSLGGSIQVIGIDGQPVAPANFASTPLVNLGIPAASDPQHIYITYTGP